MQRCETSGTGRTGGKDWIGGRNGKAERAGNVGAIVGLVRQVGQVGQREQEGRGETCEL